MLQTLSYGARSKCLLAALSVLCYHTLYIILFRPPIPVHLTLCSGMRLLRAATRVPGIELVLTALRRLLPDLTNVLSVGMLFYYIFSVGG